MKYSLLMKLYDQLYLIFLRKLWGNDLMVDRDLICLRVVL